MIDFLIGLVIPIIIGITIVIVISKFITKNKKLTTNSTSTSKKSNTWKFICGGVSVIVIIIIFAISIIMNNNDSEPLFSVHVTPCEYTENREFYLESDDSIAQKFPGITGIIIYSGKGKSDIPPGRWKGPIKFFDPENPLNGHKSFRIYPVVK